MPNATMAVPSQAPSSSINNEIARLIDELRRTLARGPRWVDINDAISLYGAPEKLIKEWSRNGFVRRSKLGPSQQSKALYSADDLNDVLCRFAAGQSPVNALRKGA